jgi:uncharacterized protein (TIGR02679 family)
VSEWEVEIMSEPPEELLPQAVAYFRSHPGFKRLLDGLAEKYCKLGRLGGVVALEDLSHEEQTTLEAFFRRPLPGKQLRFPAGQFGRLLAETRFDGLDPVALLAAWRGGELVTRQERRDCAEQARQTELRQLLAEFPAPACQAWLQAALDKEPDTRLVQRALVTDRDFARNMAAALRALTNLPEKYQRLPVFARNTCGDPHGLDMDRGAGKLFVEGLRFLRVWAGGNIGEASALSAVEERNELLYHFKLLRDDLLNFATCFGFAAYAGNGQEISYWRMASEAQAPLNVPLREIARVTALGPCAGPSEFLPERSRYDVFIVENSGVFSALLDEGASFQPLLICLHGQFKLASWALLDRLARSGAVFHYSGDFDPEGLQMAEKLLLRYPDRVRLWHMTEADYWLACPAAPLDEARLQKLASIRTPELSHLAGVIAEKRSAAYQEGILELLAQDIKRPLSASK